MTTKLCTHWYPVITIAMATLHVCNQWQPASGKRSILAYCSTVQEYYTYDHRAWDSHSLLHWLPWKQVITPCNTYYYVFLDNDDVYGCHGNIVTMATIKMFVTGRKWSQTINQMCSPPLPQSSIVAMATLNNPL